MHTFICSPPSSHVPDLDVCLISVDVDETSPTFQKQQARGSTSGGTRQDTLRQEGELSPVKHRHSAAPGTPNNALHISIERPSTSNKGTRNSLTIEAGRPSTSGFGSPNKRSTNPSMPRQDKLEASTPKFAKSKSISKADILVPISISK